MDLIILVISLIVMIVAKIKEEDKIFKIGLFWFLLSLFSLIVMNLISMMY